MSTLLAEREPPRCTRDENGNWVHVMPHRGCPKTRAAPRRLDPPERQTA